MNSQKIIIIGAGPTGLGCAYRLKELGHNPKKFRIYERNDYAGGLAHTFQDEKGFRWDVGGHVYFSHYEYFDKLYEKLMKGDYQENDRISYVRIQGTWVPYPFQNNLRYLPPKVRKECFDGLVKANRDGSDSPKTAKNFGEFIDRVFGEGICKWFMRPYNFKVWAHKPETMNKEWIGERVAIIDVERARRNIEEGKDDFGWGPNNRFKYNLLGSGQFQDRLADEVKENIEYKYQVEYVDFASKSVAFEKTDTFGQIIEEYDSLVTTIPLDVLILDKLFGDVPESVKASAEMLRRSTTYVIGVGFRGKLERNWSWMYYPEDNAPFYRVTYLSNYSPKMTPRAEGEYPSGFSSFGLKNPDGFFSCLCEVSLSGHKMEDENTIVERTIEGLFKTDTVPEKFRESIVDVWFRKELYGYPIPSVERDSALNVILPWLHSHNIYSRGRFGLWKYEVANTDHSVMQGVECANMLVNGEPETTIGIKYEVTETGRK